MMNNGVCRLVLFSLLSLIFASCKNQTNESDKVLQEQPEFPLGESGEPDGHKDIEGMVWIPGGRFTQGANDSDNLAMVDEKPAHEVYVDGFYMDIHEVTNAQFAEFVAETGYITVAERKVDWEDLKMQLPLGTPKPHDSILQPGTVTFMRCHTSPTDLQDYSQWWQWTIGANWRHPRGPESTIEGQEDHPVVHIAYEDAQAYCNWSGRRLPTEAEWEYAARAKKKNHIFFWGNKATELTQYANTWEGEFPVSNTLKDGFERSAPVGSYPPNSFGLYDMAGNVWEWTSDWYNTKYYARLKQKGSISVNPKGAEQSYNPVNPNAWQKVIKGGSFLCNASYCASYRLTSRMATTPDSAMEHLGFRTVISREMLNNSQTN